VPDEAARWERVSALFAEAAELPLGTRDAWLARECADDESLRAEVATLLAVSGESERFFDALADDAIPEALASLDGSGEDDSHAERTYGAYHVSEEIGRGGMGIVYRAEDTRLQRMVALKFLPRLTGARREARARLMEEARAASMLDHPNICTIFGFEDTPEGETFIAMALYAGETLAQRLARAPVPLGEGLEIALGISRGLAAAHASGITHRDLTPRNVMLPSSGGVKILDFGLARVAGHAGGGSVIGTPSYMSPEQVRGDPVGPASDVWSLGATMYELFTGRRPFEGGDTATVLRAILESDPRRPRDLSPRLPEALDRLIVWMLAKSPDRRPLDASTVLRALEQIAEHYRSRRVRLAVTGAIAALGALVAVVVALVASRPPSPPPKLVPEARLVLLPLMFDSTSANQTYFAAGLREVLSHELERIPGIALVTWTARRSGENTPASRRRLAAALSAVAVLEGQVAWSDSVVLRLHDGKSDRVLWIAGHNFGEKYPEGAARAFALQVARALGVPTTSRDPALRRPGVFATDPRTGHVYEAIPVTLNWFDAEAAAEARTYRGVKGHLATIASADENAFVFHALPQAVAGRYWLGGFREVRGGTPRDGWYWVSGEPFTFTSWADDEPNDYFGEDGLQFRGGADSAVWNDIDRTSGFEPFVHGFLVEYEPLRR
jgi:serine/threonine protein kinase